MMRLPTAKRGNGSSAASVHSLWTSISCLRARSCAPGAMLRGRSVARTSRRPALDGERVRRAGSALLHRPNAILENKNQRFGAGDLFKSRAEIARHPSLGMRLRH